MEQQRPVRTLDPDRPSPARIYDYLLGGSCNFAVDRAVAAHAMRAVPDLPVQAHANRRFLRRAVRYCRAEGIDQFLDLGSGIPTGGNVHEIVRADGRPGRVVYVDVDPVAVTLGREILSGNPDAAAVQYDLREPDRILADEQVRALIDLSRPVALLLIAVLHAVPDTDDPYRLLAYLRDRLAPGSLLVLSHGTDEGQPARTRPLASLPGKDPDAVTFRGRAEIARFFTGFDLAEPGLTWVPLWRPDDEAVEAPHLSNNLGAVGRRP